MNPAKKWSRYTQVSDIHVDMKKYRERLTPKANGCLEYRGPKHAQGYRFIGVLDANGERKMTVVHRVAMRMKLGHAINRTEDVRHTCNNLSCVNPEHLYIRNEKPKKDLTSNEHVIEQITTFAK
jgi:hypothetical protein